MSVTATAEIPRLLDRVRRIEETLRAHSAEAELERRLPAASSHAMRSRGFTTYGATRLRGARNRSDHLFSGF